VKNGSQLSTYISAPKSSFDDMGVSFSKGGNPYFILGDAPEAHKAVIFVPPST
jgi:hypothetical protein